MTSRRMGWMETHSCTSPVRSASKRLLGKSSMFPQQEHRNLCLLKVLLRYSGKYVASRRVLFKSPRVWRSERDGGRLIAASEGKTRTPTHGRIMSICHPDCPHFSNSPNVVFSGSGNVHAGSEAPMSVAVTREENTSVKGFLLPIPTKLSDSQNPLYLPSQPFNQQRRCSRETRLSSSCYF